MSELKYSDSIASLTVQLTSAYISNPNNHVGIDDVGNIMKSFINYVTKIAQDAKIEQSRPLTKLSVSVEDSVQDDYIVCLEDGKKLQMLKRHLNTVYGMTVEQYKERWGLPADYPIVAPNYAKRRSDIAKSTGLGVVSKKNKRRVA